MSNNFIRVLRNTELCATREAALTKLEGKLATLQDGEICIASYGATWDAAKTILGVVRFKTVDNVAKRSYTIFDNEDTADILAKIQELDATVRGNLTEADVVETDKHVGVKVVEADGKLTEVTVVESDIASAKLLGKPTDAAGTDTAFARIAQEAAARATAITEALADLDSSVAATATPDNKVYSVLTGVTQADGKLTGKTEVTLAAVAKTGSAEDVANTVKTGNEYATVEGDNVSAQISSIAKTLKTVENSIAEAKANDLKYRTVQLTDDDVTALGDVNVKEAYQIFAYTGTWDATENKGTPVGNTIKIYKDSSVKEIYLGSEADTIDKTSGKITKVTPTEANLRLNYAYMKADGTYEMVKIDVTNFLREAEFKHGLQVINGEVSVKVDTSSEGFLTVGENGVKLSGVQNAIDTAIQGLDANEKGTSEGGKVSVQVIETDGKVSAVNVTTSNIASDDVVVKNVTVNGVNATVEKNKATVTIDGTDVAVANSTETYDPTVYSAPFETKVGANHIATGDTVAAAFKKTENTISVLADEVIANEKVTTTAVSKLAESVGGVTNTDGVIKYTPKENANYIGGATSVHDATVKLDAAIKNVADSALTSVAGGDAITVSEGKTVSLKLDAAKTDNALKINTNGLYLSNVWDCGEY